MKAVEGRPFLVASRPYGFIGLILMLAGIVLTFNTQNVQIAYLCGSLPWIIMCIAVIKHANAKNISGVMTS
jgi:hypothetical protein